MPARVRTSSLGILWDEPSEIAAADEDAPTSGLDRPNSWCGGSTWQRGTVIVDELQGAWKKLRGIHWKM